jgi:hypothetical protein
MIKTLPIYLVGGLVAASGAFLVVNNAGNTAYHTTSLGSAASHSPAKPGNNGSDHGPSDRPTHPPHPVHPPCPGHYPGSAFTVTTVQLQTNQVQQGQTTSATVRSQTQADSSPTGFAGLSIQQTSGDSAPEQVVEPLTNGRATFTLPKGLKVGTYTVAASYLPDNCSGFGHSHGDNGGGADLTVTGQ